MHIPHRANYGGSSAAARRALHADDAAHMPLSLRRIARAYLAAEHADAGPLVRARAVIRMAVDVDAMEASDRGVRVHDGDWTIDCAAADPSSPRVYVSQSGQFLGLAHLGVQIPLAADEADFNEPWQPVTADLRPISLGFDPRLHRDTDCALPRNVSSCHYETQAPEPEDRQTRTAVGTPSHIREELERAGYSIVWSAP